MEIKYEKETGTGENKTISEVDKKDATHEHICYHDDPKYEGEQKPSCKRRKL